ncbi:MAG: DNA translocase FtsK [Candidatus Paceibacterota bacterium]
MPKKDNRKKKSTKLKKIEPKNNKPSASSSTSLKTETRHTIIAVVLFVVALFLFMSAFDAAGVAGQFFYKIFHYLLGVGYVLLPILFLLLGTSFIQSNVPNIGGKRLTSAILFLVSGLGIINIASSNAGGLIGKISSRPLISLFDMYASIFFLGAILIISLLVMFDARPNLVDFFARLFGRTSKNQEDDYEDEEDVYKDEEDEEETSKEKLQPALAKAETQPEEKKVKITGEDEEDLPLTKAKSKSHTMSSYVPPPLDLLATDKGKPNTGDIKANANIIKRTLQNFGIEVEMDEITIGPTVTRYALKPAEGVKLARIVALQNDLALALAAHPLRIEAPIPGKSLVGIEIPNKAKSTVGLGSLLSDEKFKTAQKPLMLALGRSISGRGVYTNLTEMPHCLVAGTTGSGKSVTIHTMITSLLYRNGPEDLKFIMVDPKRVELTLYKNIPHLLTPVITEAKKTILALKWAAKEMERRYDLLEQHTVRDIGSYQQNVYGKRKNDDGSDTERLPYIVIVIDELADIMTSYPRELETGIVRLAQMSRAVGIHLILSTQRPEVNVITGLIKANIPARIALKVSSQIDSRTILDAGGAEKLLGAGDMLYSSGKAQPERLQSAFLTETEVKDVVHYLADAYRDEIMAEINISGGSISNDKSIFESTLDEADDDDEMYEEARQCVIEAGKASTSYLQRKLKLGYARAARLMDKLEERGIIGPGDGAKPREVLEKIHRDETGNNIM